MTSFIDISGVNLSYTSILFFSVLLVQSQDLMKPRERKEKIMLIILITSISRQTITEKYSFRDDNVLKYSVMKNVEEFIVWMHLFNQRALSNEVTRFCHPKFVSRLLRCLHEMRDYFLIQGKIFLSEVSVIVILIYRSQIQKCH